MCTGAGCEASLSCVCRLANLDEAGKEGGGPMADRFRLVSSLSLAVPPTPPGVAILGRLKKLEWLRLCNPLSKGENIPPPPAANWVLVTLVPLLALGAGS